MKVTDTGLCEQCNVQTSTTFSTSALDIQHLEGKIRFPARANSNQDHLRESGSGIMETGYIFPERNKGANINKKKIRGEEGR
jgi:hypothetical protein